MNKEKFIANFLLLITFLFYSTPMIMAASPADLGQPPAGLDQVENVFERVISGSAGLAFIALFVILVVAGIRFLTSGGEPKTIASARDAITWALLGVLFLAIGWLVLQIVAVYTNVDVLKFDIKKLCPSAGC